MQQNFTMNGLQNLLYFPFKDSESRKRLLIASAIGFAGFIIPIVPWLLLLGYAGAIMKQIIVDNQEPHMPEWQNWGDFLTPGARVFGVNLIYSIPAFVPMILGYFVMMLPAFLSIFFQDPYSYNPDQFMGVFLLGWSGGMALFGIGMIFSIALWVILPPALSHVVAKDSFSAGFQFREWWRIWRANIGGFFIALILSGGLYMVFVLVMQIIYMTLILCIVLPFLMAFVSAYLTIIIFTLFAQAYKEGSNKLELQAA